MDSFVYLMYLYLIEFKTMFNVLCIKYNIAFGVSFLIVGRFLVTAVYCDIEF